MAPLSLPGDPPLSSHDPVVGSSGDSGDIAPEHGFEYFIPLDLSCQGTRSGCPHPGVRARVATRPLRGDQPLAKVDHDSWACRGRGDFDPESCALQFIPLTLSHQSKFWFGHFLRSLRNGAHPRVPCITPRDRSRGRNAWSISTTST
jgi:hypothetical protein